MLPEQGAGGLRLLHMRRNKLWVVLFLSTGVASLAVAHSNGHETRTPAQILALFGHGQKPLLLDAFSAVHICSSGVQDVPLALIILVRF